MSTNAQQVPVVMVFSGNDPSGGAGLEADIETLASHGCHAAPVLTSLTVQDTQDVFSITSLDPALVIEQARAVLEDMPVAAFKIGLLSSVEIVEALHTLLSDYPEAPVVLDPVLASGNGTPMTDEGVVVALNTLLLPLTTVVTPNSLEVRAMAPEADTLNACAMALLERETEFVLITGTHENTQQVVNLLYSDQGLQETFTWERLPNRYHGSGCTLSSSIAGLLANGLEPFVAVNEAQEYTWQTLRHGYRIGMGQYVPNRFYWARETGQDDPRS
jgi:hydroxymethylpyrimidine/phosphomethylpyrimidine kinase